MEGGTGQGWGGGWVGGGGRGRGGGAVGEVVADGAGEQDGFLRNVANPVGQFGAGELGEVGVVEENPPLARHVKALDDLDQGGLAAAVAADEGVNAAGLDGDGYVVDGRVGVLGVGEGDVLQGDLAVGLVKLDLAFQAFARRHEEQAETFPGLPESGEGAPGAHQLVEGAEDASAQHVGGDQGADGQPLVDDGECPDGGQRA